MTSSLFTSAPLASPQPTQPNQEIYLISRLTVPFPLGTTFFPNEEIPIPNTYCRGPRRCSIPSGRTLQVDSVWSGTEAADSALKHGVSGGFDPGLHTAVAAASDVTIAEGECGYFTWIGIRKEVW